MFTLFSILCIYVSHSITITDSEEIGKRVIIVWLQIKEILKQITEIFLLENIFKLVSQNPKFFHTIKLLYYIDIIYKH